MSITDTSAVWKPVAVKGQEIFEIWELSHAITGDGTGGFVRMLSVLPGNDVWMPIFAAVLAAAGDDVSVQLVDTTGAATRAIGGGGTINAAAPIADAFTFNFPRMLFRNASAEAWTLQMANDNVNLAVTNFFARFLRIQPSLIPANWVSFMVAPP